MGSQGVPELMKFMSDSGYTCTEEWLTACVDWVKDNHSNSQVTSGFIKKELYGQWLDSNLLEMESCCLPPNLLKKKSLTLKGRYGLQVNSILDIGEACYSQYNKIKKRENENTSVSASDNNQVMQSWQPKPRRCLYLTLTDGRQEIFGMELQPIPSLSIALKPGVKVLVSGPIECRLGILLLKPTHINILGGEVESLVTANCQENILSQNLNRQDADDDDEVTVLEPDQVSANDATRVHSNASLPTQPILTNGFEDDDDDDIFMEIDETVFLGM